MNCLVIAKNNWIVGLNWEWVSDNNRSKLRSIARERAKADRVKKYTHFVSHDNSGRQIALTQLDNKAIKAKNIYSLAVALLTQLPDSFLGYFTFPDGVWVYAVSEGYLVPSGDYFGLEKDAINIFSQLKEMDFEVVKKFDDINESQSYIESLLVKITTNKTESLQSIEYKLPSQTFVVAGISVLGIVFIAGIHTMYGMYVEKKRIEREILIAIEKEKISSYAVPPWESIPLVTALVDECSSSFETIPVFHEGWRVDKWSCDQKSSQVIWSKGKFGSYMDLPEGALLNIEKPNQTVTIIKHEARERGVTGLNEKIIAATEFLEISRRYQIKSVNLTEVIDGDDFNDDDKKNQYPWDLFKWSFSYQGVYPWDYLTHLSEIPGIVLNNISWSKDRNGWEANGELYVQR
ncbi:MAG: type 4b pilus protein PilO2 [Sedimenticola sp.]